MQWCINGSMLSVLFIWLIWSNFCELTRFKEKISCKTSPSRNVESSLFTRGKPFFFCGSDQFWLCHIDLLQRYHLHQLNEMFLVWLILKNFCSQIYSNLCVTRCMNWALRHLTFAGLQQRISLAFDLLFGIVNISSIRCGVLFFFH